MKDQVIKYAQEGLQEHGYDGAVDGILGPKSEATLKRVHFLNPSWDNERKAIAFAQFLLNKCPESEQLVVDGLLGPKTTAAFEARKKE